MQKQFKAKTIQPYNPMLLKTSPELDEVQGLMPMSAEDRKRLKDNIEESGEIRDPIKIYFNDDGEALILGGKNRWEIAIELGWQTVPVEILNIAAEKRSEFAIRDNLDRRHLTREQKTELIRRFLKNSPDISNNALSKQLGVDDKTVGKVRKEMESGSEIPKVDKRLGADGKSYSSENEKKITKKISLKTPARSKTSEKQIQKSLTIYLRNLSTSDRIKAIDDFVSFLNSIED